MTPYPSLDHAKTQLLQKDRLYQPTAFWDEATEKITEEIKAVGVSQFRRLPSALSYFVPNYSGAASGITPEQARLLQDTLQAMHPTNTKAHLALDHFLSGAQAALADHRVLVSADRRGQLPHLHAFSESNWGEPVEQFEWSGQSYSRSSLNYLLGLCFLKQHLGSDVPRVVLEIGGGFGTLGEIWSQSGIEGWQYIDIDLPPTHFVADQYLRQVLGADQVTGHDQVDAEGPIDMTRLRPAAVLCSWQIEQLVGMVDLFVNFISFQEMEPPVVRNYLWHVDRLQSRWVLLRNLREGKQKRAIGTVGVEQPIRGDDYQAMLPNYALVATNVHPFGFRTVDGFHSELMLFRRR